MANVMHFLWQKKMLDQPETCHKHKNTMSLFQDKHQAQALLFCYLIMHNALQLLFMGSNYNC